MSMLLDAGEQHPSDRLGYLRDDGVAERAQLVQPSGNPISHSTQDGFNGPIFSVGSS